MKSKKQGGFHTTSHWLVLSRGEGQKDEESALCKGIRHVHDVKTSERGCAHQTPSADHFVLSQSAARHNRITLPLLSATRHGESQTDISADSWLLLFDSIPEIPDSAASPSESRISQPDVKGRNHRLAHVSQVSTSIIPETSATSSLSSRGS